VRGALERLPPPSAARPSEANAHTIAAPGRGSGTGMDPCARTASRRRSHCSGYYVSTASRATCASGCAARAPAWRLMPGSSMKACRCSTTRSP
jgi:hypothetical protein